MSHSLQFEDFEALSDFRTFLERATHCTDGVVRLTSGNGVLRATVCTFSPFGLLDTAPTVLGMRVFAETSDAECDALLSVRGMLDRIAHLDPGSVTLGIPPMRETATWVGIEPPQSGWLRRHTLDASQLNGSALAGIAEVAEALPDQPGDMLVREVRAKIWGAPSSNEIELPRSVAFTAYMLGFLASAQNADLFEAERWMRVSTPTGHVLVYRR